MVKRNCISSVCGNVKFAIKCINCSNSTSSTTPTTLEMLKLLSAAFSSCTQFTSENLLSRRSSEKLLQRHCKSYYGKMKTKTKQKN